MFWIPCIWCGSTRWQLNNLFFMGNARVLLGGRKTVKFKKCENLWFSENGVTSVTPFFRL